MSLTIGRNTASVMTATSVSWYRAMTLAAIILSTMLMLAKTGTVPFSKGTVPVFSPRLHVFTFFVPVLAQRLSLIRLLPW